MIDNNNKDLFGHDIPENDMHEDYIEEMYHSERVSERRATFVAGTLLGALLVIVTKLIGVW